MSFEEWLKSAEGKRCCEGMASGSQLVSRLRLAFTAGNDPPPLHWCTPIDDALTCADCGAIMVRNGACYRCTNCGGLSGSSW